MVTVDPKIVHHLNPYNNLSLGVGQLNHILDFHMQCEIDLFFAKGGLRFISNWRLHCLQPLTGKLVAICQVWNLASIRWDCLSMFFNVVGS